MIKSVVVDLRHVDNALQLTHEGPDECSRQVEIGMRRRDFIWQALTAVSMPAMAQRPLRTVRIKVIDVIVTNRGAGSMSNYVLVKIVTN